MEHTRERLALFVGQADEYFQSRFITGFTEGAFELDMDVCVFSMYRKYQDTPEREAGDANIFTLVNPSQFRGILILKDTIQTTGVAEALEEKIHESFDGPVLVIDAESEYYPSIFLDGYQSVRMLTRHLIEKHNTKDIAFLSGKRWHRHSKERLSGFVDEMKAQGLSVPDHRIIEGDFWYKSGERCVDFLTTDSHEMPKAIICANDQMAIGVCKAFEQKGIKVPEDVIVVGSDSSMEGQSSPKSITSYLTPAHECGRWAAGWLLARSEGRNVPDFSEGSKLMAGESCGCCDPGMPSFSQKRTEWDTDISSEGFTSVNNMFFENLMLQRDLQDYISTVYAYAYQIKNASSFHLCLSGNVKYMGKGEVALLSEPGYPDRMIHAIRYNQSNLDGMAGVETTFETAKMLPDLYDKREHPSVFYFTPVFFETQNYGYAVVSFSERAQVYDYIYRIWIQTVSKGFEDLRRTLVISELNERLEKYKSAKFGKRRAVFENLSEEEKEDYKTVKQILDGNLLTYHFQPIVSAETGEIYSYEALMRSKTERRISPLAILKYAAMMDRLADVESATFINVMDILDNGNGPQNAKVFINSIPGVKITNPEVIGERLSAKSDTVVVELTEEAELGEEQLLSMKAFYEKINIEIAIDDYGTGYSNISNLLRYMPDYVKIDRSLLSDIHNRPQKQHFVREIIEFCHDNNIKALAEGVETEEELRAVIHLGADLIQGYYTAKPAPEFIGRIDDAVVEQIRIFQQEKKDGRSNKTYVAGKTNRISLLSLTKEECTEIVIGQGEMIYKDLTIVGMPSMKTDINLRIEPGYTGRITLENVWFANVKDRACINIGERADVVCVVEGDNTLKGCGIRVPESARFTLEGNGNLLIYPNGREYYGIGNDMNSRHGELLIAPVGRLLVQARGTKGVCIGSGKGGMIHINGGAIELSANGDHGVGVGSFTGDDEIRIFNCGLEMDLSFSDGVGSGSVHESTCVRIQKSYVKYTINGNDISGVGTLNGRTAVIDILDSLMEQSVHSEQATCIGARNGITMFSGAIASIRLECVGENALAIGGPAGDVKASLHSVDTKVTMHNSSGKDTFAADDDITMVNGKCSIFVNDTEIKRKLVYQFDNPKVN